MSSSDDELLSEAAGGFDFYTVNFKDLENAVNLVLKRYQESPELMFEKMHQQVGFFRPINPFGRLFYKFLDLTQKIDRGKEVTDGEKYFYYNSLDIFEKIKFLFQERTDYMNLRKHTRKKEKRDMMKIVDDVIKGDYELEDLIDMKETVQQVGNSPLQFFDRIIEDVRRKTLHTLNPNRTSNDFFDELDLKEITSSSSDQIKDAILNASIGIELAMGKDFESNEAKDACQSFLSATAMTEVENKLKHTEKRDLNELEELAEVAAVSTQAMTGGEEDEHENYQNFEIFNQSFDISFLPSEDPETYKPLEIISYIGLTKSCNQHHQPPSQQ